ncbi:hypothetical protein TNCV_1865601 [Trichonephila clavipes]|nr:hypothetical protein TNCV_1865601 [Trichonephila clavipes]
MVAEWSWSRTWGHRVDSSSPNASEYPPCKETDAHEVYRDSKYAGLASGFYTGNNEVYEFFWLTVVLTSAVNPTSWNRSSQSISSMLSSVEVWKSG